MCSICGQFSFTSVSERFYASHARMRHRGPDDEGLVGGLQGSDHGQIMCGENSIKAFRSFPEAEKVQESLQWIMGHHRLSVVDLSEKGRQPMCDKDGRYWLVYNGEIYNFNELRAELEVLGYSFRSESDTEVVLNSFLHWGTPCFAKFNGMWALAIYDTNEKKLILSRDHFGIKPLYYALNGKGLLFASELKFFSPLLSLSYCERIVADYLATCTMDHCDQTFYNEIKQVLPGQFAEYDYRQNTIVFTTYWNPATIQPNSRITFETAKEQFGSLFENAIKLRLRSDVPIGVLLSGGLDSTSILCKLNEMGFANGTPIHSFSAIFTEERFSEHKYILKTLQKCNGVVPHFVTPNPSWIGEGLQRILTILETPFRSLSVYLQFLLYEEAKKKSPAVVLLTGQGSDEVFGGYDDHYLSCLLQHLRKLNLKQLFIEGYIFNKVRKPSLRYLASYLGSELVRGASQDIKSGTQRFAGPCINPVLVTRRQVFHGEPFQNTVLSDIRYAPLPEYLRYEDRTSMSNSREARLPFLDPKLVEWGLSLPLEFKVFRGENKRLIRHSTKSYTTPEVIARKDKMGFLSPQEIWQKHQFKPVIDEAVSSIHLPFLNRTKLVSCYASYLEGRTNDWPFWWRIACLYNWLKSNSFA